MSTTSGTTIDLLSSNSGAADDDSSGADNDSSSIFMDCRRLLEEVSSLEAYHAMRLSSEATNFGHPEPPKIHLFSLSNNQNATVAAITSSSSSSSTRSNHSTGPLLVVAYTNHSVCAQIIGYNTNNGSRIQNDPIHICTLPITTSSPVQEQQHNVVEHSASADTTNAATAAAWKEQCITCLTVVSLDESTLRNFSSSSSPCGENDVDHEDDNTSTTQYEDAAATTEAPPQQHLVTVEEPHDSSSIRRRTSPSHDSSNKIGGSSSTVLLKGVVSAAAASSPSYNPRRRRRRLVVVVGTSESRVYSTELLIHHHHHHHRNNEQCRLEVVFEQPPLTSTGTATNTSSSSSCTLFEVLPRSTTTSPHRRSSSKSKKKNSKVDFAPTGGVSSISAYQLDCSRGRQRQASTTTTTTSTYVWITYRDGTLVRLHHAGLFPSVWERGAARDLTLQDMLLNTTGGGNGGVALVRCQVQLSPDMLPDNQDDNSDNENMNSHATIVPLPRYHASPLTPLVPFVDDYNDEDDDDDDLDSLEGTMSDENDDDENRRQDLLPDFYEALVFAGAGMDHFPTFCCYTSEEPLMSAGGMTGDGRIISGSAKNSHYGGSGRRGGAAGVGGGGGGGGDSESAVLGVVVGGTKALMGGVVGALRWGLGGSSTSHVSARGPTAATTTTSLGRSSSQLSATSSTSNHNINNSIHSVTMMDDNRSVDYSVDNMSLDGTVTTSGMSVVSTSGPATGAEVPGSPFPSLWDKPISLYAGIEFHDVPRKIEFCSIDPDGAYAAVADGLGRVMLIDLTTKQVIRLWKGYREATCHWIQGYCAEQEGTTAGKAKTTTAIPSCKRKSAKYLVVHSRLRRVVEVWKIRYGSRVASFPVGRDAQIVPCTMGLYPSRVTSCFILHRSAPGSSNGGGVGTMQANQLEKIQVDPHQLLLQQQQLEQQRAIESQSIAGGAGTGTSNHSLRLQHLRQILSTTNFQYSKDDVYQALLQIKALGDLATCLDLIATADVLEERLGVNGSAFQKLVLDYCRKTLEEAMKGSGDGKQVPVSASSPNAKTLMRKIQYHSRIVKAYDIMRKAEATKGAVERGAKPPSHFCAEALGWASTFQQVTRGSIDIDAAPEIQRFMRYSTFASSFIFPTDAERSNFSMRIYFSESTRTRKVLLGHVFKPILLGDIYSLSAVNSFFETLGIQDDLSYILKCFGEWFMTLKADDIIKKGLVVSHSCLNRFLASLANRQLENKADNSLALDVLYKFCEESTDLVRAFMLSALCREAVKKVADQKEKRTYGKLSSIRLLRYWEVLLRRLRVCLLVSLRVKEARFGPIPLSVQNVNAEGTFSVYEWVAQDELSVSHHHEEILSLEMACKHSSYVFDPSTSAGDDPARFKVLQDACLALAITDEERAEFLVDQVSEDSGALLLFLSSHNEPVILAAHRALLLAAQWSKNPRKLQVLRDSLMSLRSLTDSPGYAALAMAVRLEVWTRVVCPIYRARLFGFVDVQEVSEDVVAPLLQDKQWLTEFGPMALLVLDMLSEISWNDCESTIQSALAVSTSTSTKGGGSSNRETWPAVRPDCVLKKLVDKMRRIDSGAIDVHCVIVCALLVSNNIESLVQCAPAIYQCFLPTSLSTPVAKTPSGSPEQDAFLSEAVVNYAREYNGPPMDRFQGLEELEMMSKLWGFSIDTLWTYFLLAMYGFAKDHFVDDLLTKVYSQIDVKTFVNGGVDLACCRLAAFLDREQRRDVMGVLDADVCDWIQERAAAAQPLVGKASVNTDIPVASTHLFALRLLSLSASAEIEASQRGKIHSMAVLSGILNKL